MIEVTGRFGQPPLSVAPGGGFPYVGFPGAGLSGDGLLGAGFPGVGFACLSCTMAAEGDVDPAFGDCARVGCGCVRAVLRDLLWHVASLRDDMGREGFRWNWW